MAQQKFITSHKTRVKRANEYIKNSPERITIIDREAFVEFYLLEDIERLYKYRLSKEQAKVPETHAGELAKQRNMQKFSNILEIFQSVIEIAWALIDDAHYKEVWRAINEHALMIAAGSSKNLDALEEMGRDLLRKVFDDAVQVGIIKQKMDEDIEDLEAHDANARTVSGLPSAEEIGELLKAAEAVIPDMTEEKVRKPKPNIQ